MNIVLTLTEYYIEEFYQWHVCVYFKMDFRPFYGKLGILEASSQK